MANSTSTSLNDLLPQIVAEALFIASERSIMRGLVRNYTIPMNSGKQITVPKYPIQTAVGLSEGTDMSGASGDVAVSTDGAVLTVSEVGIMTNVTDYARMTSGSNVIADVGRLFGEAIARKIDKDLLGLFTGFATTVGDNSTALSAATVAKAIATLRGKSVPAEDLFCVVHPFVAYDLKAGLTNTFANPAAGVIQNEAMTTGYVGTLFGVPVFESANIADTDGDSTGAIFHRDALGLAMMSDIRIETERNASLRADEVVATAVYGVGEIYDDYGVKIVADSSIVDPA